MLGQRSFSLSFQAPLPWVGAFTIARRKQRPSVYRTLKSALRKAVRDPRYVDTLFHDVLRCHILYIHVSSFLNHALKLLCEQNVDVSSFGLNAIQLVFSIFCAPNPEAYTARNPTAIKREWLERFLPLVPGYMSTVPNRSICIDGITDFNGLSFHCNNLAKDMWKNYKNNIALNFLDYANRFVNVHFKPANQAAVDAYRAQLLARPVPDGVPRRQHRQALYKAVRQFRGRLTRELSAVKDDLVFYDASDAFTCAVSPRYRTFLNAHRPHVLPSLQERSYECITQLLQVWGCVKKT